MTPIPPNDTSRVTVRKAERQDASTLLQLVDGLAHYEKLAPPDAAAKERLVNDMFATPPRIEAFLAEFEGQTAGYALAFETYSSFLALPTLYLEDIFVLPAFRGKQIGYELFTKLVDEALARGCGRMEWAVLDWNRLAIEFYKRLGATHMSQWQTFRLARNDMEAILKRHETRNRETK
jgi:GNAT superfamily N-acetyltransferase